MSKIEKPCYEVGRLTQSQQSESRRARRTRRKWVNPWRENAISASQDHRINQPTLRALKLNFDTILSSLQITIASSNAESNTVNHFPQRKLQILSINWRIVDSEAEGKQLTLQIAVSWQDLWANDDGRGRTTPDCQPVDPGSIPGPIRHEKFFSMKSFLENGAASIKNVEFGSFKNNGWIDSSVRSVAKQRWT